MISGRVFNQCIDQSEVYPYHFCIIQGSNYDLKKALEYGNSNINQFFGAKARLNTFTTVIHSTGGVKNSLLEMEIQSRKCLDGKGKVKQFNAKTYNAAFNFLAYGIRGVSVKKADRIVNSLGLETLNDLLTIGFDDLVSVEGIGVKNAKLILGAIQ